MSRDLLMLSVIAHVYSLEVSVERYRPDKHFISKYQNPVFTTLRLPAIPLYHKVLAGTRAGEEDGDCCCIQGTRILVRSINIEITQAHGAKTVVGIEHARQMIAVQMLRPI